MEKIEIVLWDEFDLETDMKLKMGRISVLTRYHPKIVLDDIQPSGPVEILTFPTPQFSGSRSGNHE